MCFVIFGLIGIAILGLNFGKWGSLAAIFAMPVVTALVFLIVPMPDSPADEKRNVSQPRKQIEQAVAWPVMLWPLWLILLLMWGAIYGM